MHKYKKMKNILITGSTDGIGKLAAIDFALKGHRVYIHGRSQGKVDSTIAEIKSASKNNNIDGFVADFADLDQVKEMAKKINQQIDVVDVLINNAGVFKSKTSECKQRYDLRFTVNYLAPYLLTNQIISLIEKSEDARIINLSSAAQSNINMEAMLGKQAVGENEAYAQSKLAITMWSVHLSKLYPNQTVIAVNPGSLLNTKMANEAYGQHWSPANKGSNIIIDLALSEDHKNKTGQYFDNDSGAYALAHSDVYHPEKVQQLISYTKQILNI